MWEQGKHPRAIRACVTPPSPPLKVLSRDLLTSLPLSEPTNALSRRNLAGKFASRHGLCCLCRQSQWPNTLFVSQLRAFPLLANCLLVFPSSDYQKYLVALGLNLRIEPTLALWQWLWWLPFDTYVFREATFLLIPATLHLISHRAMNSAGREGLAPRYTPAMWLSLSKPWK